MMVKRNYKILSYILLASIIVVSFLFSNFLLNQIINDKAPGSSIIYILLVLILNFGMFFIVFRLIQLLLEKETIIDELSKHIQAFREVKQNDEFVEVQKETDVDQLIEQSIPTSPQTLGLQKFSEKVLANIAKFTEVSQGIFYLKEKESGEFKYVAKFAYYSGKEPVSFFEGETLPGQVAKDKKLLNITQLPEDYIKIKSGLGEATPLCLVIVPVLEKDETIAVIELAGFKPISGENEKYLEKLSSVLGKIVLKIK